MSKLGKTPTVKQVEATTTTLRNAARQAVLDSVTEAAQKSHERNYEKLHVRRDGTVNWSECINKSDDIIDDQADGFCAVQSVACVGTGSVECNCDYCDNVYSETDEKYAVETGRAYDKDSKYATKADAISDALGDSDLSGIEDDMMREFDEIPVGYFNDEEINGLL